MIQTDLPNNTRRTQQAKKTARGRPIRKIELSAEPVTPENVTAAFRAARVTVPDAAEIERLAGLFSIWKCYFLQARRDAAYSVAAGAARLAAADLAEALRPMLAHWERMQAADDPFAKDFVSKLKGLSWAIESTQPKLAWQPVKPGAEICDWRWLADVIVKAIAPSFPGNGMAAGGPASRFLAEMIPQVSGDVVTAIAIATQLKKKGR